jgi:TetR/AcrR family transcriptional regulator, transcriptional repressor for nem operon
VHDDVLSSAVDMFWRNGYEATSVDELTSAMGIGRGSLYNAFGDKRELFIASLDRYRCERQEQLEQALASAVPARVAIEALFRQSVDRLWRDRSHRGCLLVNSAAELAAKDPAVAARARRTLEQFADAFRGALERGQADGSISHELDVQATGRYLAGALVSLRLLAKFASRQLARDVVELTLTTLGERQTEGDAA